jgi:hypothetical protein
MTTTTNTSKHARARPRAYVPNHRLREATSKPDKQNHLMQDATTRRPHLFHAHAAMISQPQTTKGPYSTASTTTRQGGKHQHPHKTQGPVATFCHAHIAASPALCSTHTPLVHPSPLTTLQMSGSRFLSHQDGNFRHLWSIFWNCFGNHSTRQTATSRLGELKIARASHRPDAKGVASAFWDQQKTSTPFRPKAAPLYR